MNLYTLGYEGVTVGQFIARLEKASVRTVVDVRELPLSRKAGFSKRTLADRLRLAGIEYIHIPSLGCPKVIRDRYREDGNWTKYRRAFNTYLATRATDVQQLARTARTKTTCLVCYEADFNYCHRSYVARAAALVGAPAVAHLTATGVKADQPLQAAA